MSAALNTRSPEHVDRTVDSLSNRQLEIARLLVEGLTVRAIAECLGVAFKAVANCQTAIRRKLGAPTPARLLQVAARDGIVAPRR